MSLFFDKPTPGLLVDDEYTFLGLLLPFMLHFVDLCNY